MTAFAVVRFQAKRGMADAFERTFCELRREMPGLRRVVLIKTGDHRFCSIGEWDALDDLVKARPAMSANLERMRPMLEVLSEELGVTDPVSGEAVHDLCPQR
jgi:hypothetical protein